MVRNEQPKTYKDNLGYVLDQLTKVESSIEKLEGLRYIPSQLREVQETIDKIRDEINAQFVQKSEFAPIKAIVYGLVTMILVGFATALVTLVFKA